MTTASNYYSKSRVFRQRGDFSDARNRDMRALAQAAAINRFYVVTTPTAFTDNSTGVARSAYRSLLLPVVYDAVAGGAAAQNTAFNAAIVKADNAISVLAETLNKYLHDQLGAPAATYGGTVAVSGTVPAMDKSCTVAGSAAVSVGYVSGVAAMSKTRNNMSTVIRMANGLLSALGMNTLADLAGGSPVSSNLPLPGHVPFGAPSNKQPDPDAAYAMTTPAAAVAGTGTVAGNTSIAKSVVDTYLDHLADDVATLVSLMGSLRSQIAAKSIVAPVVALD